jgi:hypothetical protein
MRGRPKAELVLTEAEREQLMALTLRRDWVPLVLHRRQRAGGGGPGEPAVYVGMCHLYFDSIESFQGAFGPHAQEIIGDIPNYTDFQRDRERGAHRGAKSGLVVREALCGQISRPSNPYLLKTSFVRYRPPAMPTSQQ